VFPIQVSSSPRNELDDRRTQKCMRSTRLPFALHVVNEAIAFLLELVMLGALGWWGAKDGSTLAGSVLRGAGAPLLASMAWALFAAPKAKIRLPVAGVLAVKALVFGSGAAAIYALGLHVAAGLFATTSFVNTALAAFDRDAAMRASDRRGSPRLKIGS
jgi:hypothetical protein